jgi:hypothetical protein
MAMRAPRLLAAHDAMRHDRGNRNLDAAKKCGVRE